MQHMGFRFAAVVLLATLLSGCSEETVLTRAPATRPADVEPRAEAALRQMSAILSRASTFSVRSLTTMDEPLPSGQLAQFSRETRITVRRPDRLLASLRRGKEDWSVWYSGTDLTILDRGDNTYATAKVPGRIDDMLDELAEKYDLTMPLADLLFTDPYKVLTAKARTGQFVGTDEVDGVQCTHLSFTQDNVDWQIWIETGKAPLPRKIVIDYKTLAGRPQFEARLRDWNLSAVVTDDQFKPALPVNARKLEMSALLSARNSVQ